MSHSDICKGYSDEALNGIVRQLSISGDWPARLRAASNELNRRKKNRRNPFSEISH